MADPFETCIGTQPVREQHAVDVAALADWLRGRLDDFDGPLQIEQFKGGQSNPTYLLRTPRKCWVMRAKPGPAAKLLPSAHAIEREFRVMGALAGQGVPVATMHLLCEDEDVIGRAFYVMSHVQGRVLWDQALPGMTPAGRGAVYDEMNRVIAALHKVTPVAAGLADFGKPGNYFERQIGRWSKQYLASQTQTIDAMDKLLDWLPTHLPAQAQGETQVAVVHGDFRLDNLIFHPHEARILAVLDWELSTLGHPLADFSYHCLAWHIAPGVFRGIGGLDHASLGIPSEAAYVRRYCERTGRGDLQALLADWSFFLAYNLFRLAAITQGIARRALEGTASSPEARATGERTRPLAELAWRFAQGGASR